MRSRLAALLLLPLLLPALLLTGCVSVPFASGVDPGGPIEGEVDVDFDFLPSGPSAGATQEEILRGFLAATTAAQDNYRIARSFLAEDVADVWNPYDSTLVRAREGAVERLDDATLTYSVPIVASVDAVGRYSVSDSTSSQTLPAFRFVQEGGEWRIAELGDGILISQQAFPSAFSQHTIYYWDSAFRNLVPDLRWFPTRSEVATRIVRAVLEPPTSWLGQGATVSAIPEGTELALSPVAVVAGTAQIDLTSEVLSLSERERQRVRLQLAASLRAVSGVVGVDITVDQNLVAIPEWTTGAPDVVPQVDPRVLLRTDESFGFATGGEVEPLGALSPRVIELEATAVALAPGRTTLATAL
ncbi:MAG: GerMN domain-containing protein, partial [Yonghaparkia sp.]|nr:GerMN domain-containing protein [Microcella sp.]